MKSLFRFATAALIALTGMAHAADPRLPTPSRIDSTARPTLTGAPLNTRPSETCPAGSVFSGGTCAPITTYASCPTGQVLSGGSCVAISTLTGGGSSGFLCGAYQVGGNGDPGREQSLAKCQGRDILGRATVSVGQSYVRGNGYGNLFREVCIATESAVCNTTPDMCGAPDPSNPNYTYSTNTTCSGYKDYCPTGYTFGMLGGTGSGGDPTYTCYKD